MKESLRRLRHRWARSPLVWAALLAFAGSLWSCANTIPPQGGALDEEPPQLDTAQSTPNYQVRFEKQPIDLVFDEWIQLEDIATQVVVSPPVDNYDIRLRRKGIRFTFGEEETLREDVTYTINFGSAIKDLTESNPAEDLRFVFSTGDELDSLEVSGQILDALTGEPVEGALFLLYENTADSVVRTERPFYFARTDTSGQFLISNVRAATFKGFALLDERPNYQFDPGEAIGFPDSLIRVNENISPTVSVRLFKEFEVPNFVEDEQETFGRVKLTFDGPTENIEVSTYNGPDIFPDRQQDSLIVWYSEEPAANWNLVFRYDTLLQDTLRIDRISDDEFQETARLRQTPKVEQLDVHPTRPLYLSFNHPLAVIDSNRIVLTSDSIAEPLRPRVRIDTANVRRLEVDHNWRSGLPYTLSILPAGIFDIFGIGNADTLRTLLQVKPPSDYGTLNLEVTGLDSTLAYVLQLRDAEERVIAERTASGQSRFSDSFGLLPPGIYQLRLITDFNANGRWDTGSYDEKRQPEPIFLRELEELRANWDLDAQVDFVERDPPATDG